MSRSTQFLEQSNPISGRWLKENGSFVNVADIMDLANSYNILTATVRNGSSLLSRRSEVTTEFFYYGFIVPSGRELILFDRTITTGAGSYEIDTLTNPDGFTGGTQLLKTTLRSGSTSSVTTNIFAGVTPTNVGNATLQDEDFIDNGKGLGSGRSSAGSRQGGELRIFGAGSTGLLRVRRLQPVKYTATIRIFCWEQPQL